MAVVYKCDNCGKEGKHGDEWLSFSLNRTSIREERPSNPYSPMVSDESFNYLSLSGLACSAPCVIRLIGMKAAILYDLVKGFVEFDEPLLEKDHGLNTNRG